MIIPTSNAYQNSPPFPFTSKVDPCGQTEVADFNLHLIIEEEVAELQVAMDNVALVEVLDAEQQVLQEVACLRLGDGLAPLVQLHQTLRHTQSHQPHQRH